jgi:hypothetical protein
MYLYESSHALDFSGLAALANVAWSRDYEDQVRIHYDESYLRWLLDGNDWTGLVVIDEESSPVACMFSLFRRLRFGSEITNAAYSTQWAVRPDRRGRGVGLWVTLNQLTNLFTKYSRDVNLGMAHEGHAAIRGRGLFRHDRSVSSFGVALGPIWTRKLGGAPSHREPPVRTLQSSDRSNLVELFSHCPFPTFTPEESFERLYLRSPSEHSGTLWYEEQAGEACAICYSRHSLAVKGVELGVVAQIQTLHPQYGSATVAAAALRATIQHFHNEGCLAVCCIEQGTLTRAVLQRAGFEESSDRLRAGFSAKPVLAQSLRLLTPPFVLDFL